MVSINRVSIFILIFLHSILADMKKGGTGGRKSGGGSSGDSGGNRGGRSGGNNGGGTPRPGGTNNGVQNKAPPTNQGPLKGPIASDDPLIKSGTSFPGNFPAKYDIDAGYKGYGRGSADLVLKFRSAAKKLKKTSAWGSSRYKSSADRKKKLLKQGIVTGLLEAWSMDGTDYSFECALNPDVAGDASKFVNYGRKGKTNWHHGKCRRLVIPYSFQALANQGKETNCTTTCETRAHDDFFTAQENIVKNSSLSINKCQQGSGAYVSLQYAELNPLDVSNQNFACVCSYVLVVLRIKGFSPGFSTMGECDSCQIQLDFFNNMPKLGVNIALADGSLIPDQWPWMPSDYPYIAQTELRCESQANNCHGDLCGNPSSGCGLDEL